MHTSCASVKYRSASSMATLTAIEILKAGGKAIDAAVGACAVQCVVEAGSTGIGGDCFALLTSNGNDDVVAYNGSGRTPAAAHFDWFRENGITSIERSSPHACRDLAPLQD